jgi:ABC-2 type transport system permease protein
MSAIVHLLSPRWKKVRNEIRDGKKEKLRLASISFLILGLWTVIFIVFVKALRYFTAEEMFGTIAATKLLSMLLATFAFVAVISNVIATFSTYYLSEDLELVLAAPVSPTAVFGSRFVETLVDSSWMVLVFGLPVFLAYGWVFEAPWSFYVLIFVGFSSLLAMITALSVLVVQNLVKSFPVRRLRDLFMFVGLLIFIGMYLLFRMIRPEEFFNPEGFASIMDYLSIMSEPSSPLFPTTWLQEILRPYITGYGFEEIWLYLGLLVTGAVASYRVAGHCHQALHFAGYSRAMEARGARLSKSRLIGVLEWLLGCVFHRTTVRLIIKETLLMARDWGRLSQLLLLLALILVYLYNFSALPKVDSPEISMVMRNVLAFLNIGLAGFVLSSLGVRFLFPALSGEGRAFWILKKAPVSLRKILWVKFFFYLVPMLILGLFLVVATNYLLGMGTFIGLLSTVTMAFLTVGITSLSIGMGVIHADFRLADPSRAFSGFGGLMTMIYGGLSVTAVILLEAFPVYRIVAAPFLRRGFTAFDYVLCAACFAAAFAVALFLIIYPMRVGMRRISELEI